MSSPSFDVLVVGGGHAGIEAAAAAARLGATAGLISLEAEAVGRMSCNPAIGGIGKGQLAREIDALGGLMGQITDRAGIQFRLLNTSKGLAVQSPRAQCDRPLYEKIAQEYVAAQERLEVIEGEAVALLWRLADGTVVPEPPQEGTRELAGVRLASGVDLCAPAVILTTGTFLEGVLHTGLEEEEGGRMGESGAAHLGDVLRSLGLPTARLKTGTPPRLAADSVDYSVMKLQPGDEEPVAFSFLTDALAQEQIPCWQTTTTARTQEIVRENLHQAPMYAGRIDGKGPRYCPSLEDKVVRFADRDAHTIFLEPEGFDSPLLYANGISTSLPVEIQDEFVRTCVGLENARIVQPGYAVAYTHIAPRCLRRTLELRDVPGLYLAGQICGTSGYEEAAAQGIMAGFNVALKQAGKEPFVLGRHEAYIGVLIDDLVVSDPTEPYRMFTSRAEHRLLLRHDNADIRLTPHAIRLGSACQERSTRFEARRQRVEQARQILDAAKLPREGGGPVKVATDLLRRPGGAAFAELAAVCPSLNDLGLDSNDRRTLSADVLYEGYSKRQQAWVDRGSAREGMTIPGDYDFRGLRGLREEAVQTLEEIRPETLGRASRLAGVTPADVALIEIALTRDERARARS